METTGFVRGDVLIASCDHKRFYGWELGLSRGDQVVFESDYSADWAYGHVLRDDQPVHGHFLKAAVHRPGQTPHEHTMKSAVQSVHHAEYFDGYSGIWVHWLMLSDDARTLAYKKAIFNADLAGKTVLDLGCGSGILSSFCALAGAKRVYAVDASAIVEQARAVVKANQLEDIVTVIQGDIDTLDLPVPLNSIDVIVSEWMGHFLICEAMIASVLRARDKYLSPTGLMLPGHASMYLAPVALKEEYAREVGYLTEYNGLDLSMFVEEAEKKFRDKMLVQMVPANSLISRPQFLFEINMYTAVPEDLHFTRDFVFVAKEDTEYRGVCSWFDCEFTNRRPGTCSPEDLITTVLSTSPFAKETHWWQTTFVQNNDVLVKEGEEIRVTVTVERDQVFNRQFDIHVRCDIADSDYILDDSYYM